MPRKETGRKGMPAMSLTCPSCAIVRIVQYREPSRRATKCRSCAAFKGGPKPIAMKGWSKDGWMAHIKAHGIPNAKRFDGSASGSEHPNWKGGITPANKLARSSGATAAWRREVFKRDGFTCVLCHTRGGRLHAHHIKAFSKFPEFRHDVANGVTVCPACHIDKVHGGRISRPVDLIFQYPFRSERHDVTSGKWYPSY